MKALTIGQLASAASVHTETVRYYEKRGLLAEPARSESGYRLYSQDAVGDIQFIKSAQEVGFTLAEIQYLLLLRKKDSMPPVAEMRRYAASKVKEIEERIGQLEALKALLQKVTDIPLDETPYASGACPVIRQIAGRKTNDGDND
ncbi:heavy metal-responsive transcriptional regulator [Paenibacillus chartarius]|uniref:Heavy metal-responsive transcriptional regulator n=1 Tax=Paenibacillus chartarius TaxID=747481 RepID=A0ABV6DR74_9BACL